MCGLLPLLKKPGKQSELRPVWSCASINWESLQNSPHKIEEVMLPFSLVRPYKNFKVHSSTKEKVILINNEIIGLLT